MVMARLILVLSGLTASCITRGNYGESGFADPASPMVASIDQLVTELPRPGLGWMITLTPGGDRVYAVLMSALEFRRPAGFGAGEFAMNQVGFAEDEKWRRMVSGWLAGGPGFVRLTEAEAGSVCMGSVQPIWVHVSGNMLIFTTEEGGGGASSSSEQRINAERWAVVKNLMAGEWTNDMQIAVGWQGSESTRVRSMAINWRNERRYEVLDRDDISENLAAFGGGGEVNFDQRSGLYRYRDAYAEGEYTLAFICLYRAMGVVLVF
jgi:hypothetical protein